MNKVIKDGVSLEDCTVTIDGKKIVVKDKDGKVIAQGGGGPGEEQ